MERENDSGFFRNGACAYFPCHKGANPDQFNCLFCYCPLYALGEQCGGNFHYLETGIKDCSDCLLPHSEGGYEYIIANFPKIAELTKKRNEE